MNAFLEIEKGVASLEALTAKFGRSEDFQKTVLESGVSKRCALKVI